MVSGIGEALGRAFIVFGIICLGLGGFLMWLIPILWNWIKPFLNSLTV